MNRIQSNVFPFVDEKRFLMSGPCSAESAAQIMSTARFLSKQPRMALFRAGVWKPRTRPGQFEGMGVRALSWLADAKEETGLPLAVEVATAKHVELAVQYGVDVLWLGARTVVNPFSVQEIADTLRKHPVPVMVKNPVNPDINLWIGAMERLLDAGAPAVAAVHRGFYFFEESPFRNAPMWEIPIELKRRYPEIPVICDPSHICGDTPRIPEISQKALDLEMEGLMLEVHPEPENAITDSAQQLSFDAFDGLINNLIIRKYSASPKYQDKISRLRNEIDKIDTELLEILARRMEIIREIGEYKKARNITILQSDRFREMMHDRLQKADKYDLDNSFLLKLLQQVHQESVRLQQQIMKNDPS
jgi:chorismate mutase